MTRGVTVILVWGALGLAACGSSEAENGSKTPAPSAATAGSANGGSTNGGNGSGGSGAMAQGGSATAGNAGAASTAGKAGSAGGAGTPGAAGAPGSAPLRGACRAYVVAYCEKQGECSGSTNSVAQCLLAADRCPDLLMSPGTGHSLQNLLDCVEPLPHGELLGLAARDPARVRHTRFAREGRALCVPQPVSEHELQSGRSRPDVRGLPRACCARWRLQRLRHGVPARPGVRGGSLRRYPCDAGSMPPPVLNRQAEGEACFSETCLPELYCAFATDATEGVCQKLPAAGSACVERGSGPRCASTAYCDGQACRALPVAGEACVNTDPFCADLREGI